MSSEVPAQTEARLRGVFRRSQVAWLPGSWEFVEGAEATGRHDGIAVIRDEGQVSALCPARTAVAEGFGTVVMVAHRMRTVRRADRVVFPDGGRIVEEGSHDELLRRGGRYAEFWSISMAA